MKALIIILTGVGVYVLGQQASQYPEIAYWYVTVSWILGWCCRRETETWSKQDDRLHQSGSGSSETEGQ